MHNFILISHLVLEVGQPAGQSFYPDFTYTLEYLTNRQTSS